MSDEIFYRLRDVLDSMPNGFPPAADGLEMHILKKIFTEEEAAVAVNMKMKFETPEDVAGCPLSSGFTSTRSSGWTWSWPE
jgi:electron transport complex protein RnfB